MESLSLPYIKATMIFPNHASVWKNSIIIILQVRELVFTGKRDGSDSPKVTLMVYGMSDTSLVSKGALSTCNMPTELGYAFVIFFLSL